MSELNIATEKVVKSEVVYSFGERELDGKAFIVAGTVRKGKDKNNQPTEFVKGLWVRKEKFSLVAPELVKLVKTYAPEALQTI